QGQVSWVIVDLSPSQPGGTQLRLEHIAHVPDDLWDQFGPGAVGVGWDSALLGLDRHVAGDRTLDPKTAMAWLMSDEGKAFVRESSDAWCLASIADGTNAVSARAAAERTRAPYTGEGEARTDAACTHWTFSETRSGDEYSKYWPEDPKRPVISSPSSSASSVFRNPLSRSICVCCVTTGSPQFALMAHVVSTRSSKGPFGKPTHGS